MVQNYHTSQNKAIIGTFDRSNIYDQKGAISFDFPALFWQKKEYFYVSPTCNNDGKKQPLSIEKLRSFQGFTTISDDEALQVITSLDQLSRLLLSCAITDSKSENYGSSSAVCKRDKGSDSS